MKSYLKCSGNRLTAWVCGGRTQAITPRLCGALPEAKRKGGVQKISVILFFFAFIHTTLAQTNYIFQINDPDGWVNIRTGAGTNYEVAAIGGNGMAVYRNFSEQTINGWIPIVYRDTLHKLYNRGYIHGSRLTPHDYKTIQLFMPKFSEIDTLKRTQLQEEVTKINSTVLLHDTLFYRPTSHRFNYPPEMLEIVSFDETGRVRKYFWNYAVGDASWDYCTTIAYYNEIGELVYFKFSSANHVAGTYEIFWLHEGKIVDFQNEWICGACEIGDFYWSITDLRSRMGKELMKITMQRWGLDWLAMDFLDTQTLLSVIKDDNYKGQHARMIEIFRKLNDYND